MNNQIIPAQPPNQPIRILGIWISEKSILHPNRQKISEETTQIKKALQRKIITGVMATYIYNMVLLPRIEYKLQTTFLTPNMIKTKQRIIDSTIKHKFQLEQTISNSWFYNLQIFNYKSILDLQNKVIISNLQYKLTNFTTKKYTN